MSESETSTAADSATPNTQVRPSVTDSIEIVTVWMLSLLLAGLIFLLSIFLYGARPAFTGLERAPRSLSWTDFWVVWNALAAPGPWTAIGLLIALAMIPITVFLANALWNGKNSDITDMANHLLRWSGLAIGILAWLFLPALLRWETIPLAIPALGVSLIGVSLFRFAKPSRGMQASRAKQLARLSGVKGNLRTALVDYLPQHSDDLSQFGATRILWWRVGTPIGLLLLNIICTTVILFATGVSPSLTISNVFIIVGLSLFFTVVAVVDILLSCGLRLKCGYVVDRLDNVIGGVTFVSISVMWVASTLIAVSRQADRTVQAILLIEGVAVPAIGCIIVRWFGRRAVDYYYWRKCLRLLHRAADTQVPTDGINH